MAGEGRIWEEAKRVSGDHNRMKDIWSRAQSKLRSIAGDSEQFKDFSERLKVLLRMIKAHFSGECKSFSTRTILLIVFALLYFVIPTDAIPDFLPALGFTDDISILYFVWNQVNTDILKFIQWEQPE